MFNPNRGTDTEIDVDCVRSDADESSVADAVTVTVTDRVCRGVRDAEGFSVSVTVPVYVLVGDARVVDSDCDADVDLESSIVRDEVTEGLSDLDCSGEGV